MAKNNQLDKPDKLEVLKPRVVIHIGNNLQIRENKIYYFLLEMARKQFNKDNFNKKLKDDIKQEDIIISRVYKTTIKEIDNFFKISSFKKTKNYLIDLQKIDCKIDIFQRKKGKEISSEIYFNLISKLSINSNNEVEIVFPDFVEKEIEKPNFFTIFDLNIISRFRSNFALILYENAKSFIIPRNPNCQVPIMTVETFKELMGIKDKFATYSNLKNKVILTAIKEINEKSDIDIVLKEIKEDKKVVKLSFKAYNKKKKIDTKKSIKSIPKKIETEEEIFNKFYTYKSMVFWNIYLKEMEDKLSLNNNKLISIDAIDIYYNIKTKRMTLKSQIFGTIKSDNYIDEIKLRNKIYELRNDINFFNKNDLDYLTKEAEDKEKYLTNESLIVEHERTMENQQTMLMLSIKELYK